MSAATVLAAHDQLIRAAIQVIAAKYAEEGPWADASSAFADELLAYAARDLTRAIDARPEADRPSGWGEVPSAAVVSICNDCLASEGGETA